VFEGENTMRPIFIVFKAFSSEPICAFERREDATAQIDKWYREGVKGSYFYRETTLIWDVPRSLINIPEVNDAVSEG
jgi:hypothetical protein